MFVAPEFSSATDSSFGFIYNKRNTILFTNSPQLLVEVRGRHLVTNGWNRFNNNSCNILSAILSLSNYLSKYIQTPVFFSFVLNLMICKWVFHNWKGGTGPIICWNTWLARWRITHREGSNRISVVPIFKSKSTEVRQVRNWIIFCVFCNCN